MTTSQEWAERISGFVPRDEFDGVKPTTRPFNRSAHIERVIAVQGLTPAEAAEQVSGRIYEAGQYLTKRRNRV